jgi:prevent-host-death family protein
MRRSKESAVNIADAKRQFSDLLGRVAYGRETIVIMRRGRPMAKLVPLQEEAEEGNELAQVEGWLTEDDPFFMIMDEIVSDRRKHHARVFGNGSVTKTPRQD